MNGIVLLGIDFGSGGCKVTAIDGTGTILGEASVEYTTHYEHQGWSEQDPGDWYPAMCEAKAWTSPPSKLFPSTAPPTTRFCWMRT